MRTRTGARGAAAVVGLVLLTTFGSATGAGAAPLDDRPSRPVPVGMGRMHELMMSGNPGMQRMHELRTSANPGMERMHELMC